MIGPAIRDFDAAVQELDRVMTFLISCGGVYAHPQCWLPSILLFLLGAGQYAKLERNGEIVYFACYFLVSEELADELIQHTADECRALIAATDGENLQQGSVMYVVEMGSKGTRRDMIRLRNVLDIISPSRIAWRRPERNRANSFEVRRQS